ncbi:PP0621 family protein [Methyloversatilis sp.]|uniref:PP0621 family protein n=1 Tax=Methyloversatilis sp. TaxID=2569862 RepID=UPI0035B4E006
MSRILFFLLLALVAWFVFFKKKSPPRDEDATKPPQPRPVERIVQCAHCGLRLPEGEALSDGERHFCCTGHRDEHAGRN